jgi:hypothetical protein
LFSFTNQIFDCFIENLEGKNKVWYNKHEQADTSEKEHHEIRVTLESQIEYWNSKRNHEKRTVVPKPLEVIGRVVEVCWG